jgi:hypothetical protein
MSAFATTDDILRPVGIMTKSTAPGRYYATCPQCSHSRRKRKEPCLGVTIYEDGGAGWRCFHCDWTGGGSLTSSRRSSARSRVRVPIPVSCESEAGRVHRALAIWNEARDPRGTIVEHYLTVERGLRLPDEIAGSVIRFHPALFFEGAQVPAMVALFRDIKTNEPCGIHRVFLDSEGRKIDRWMLGRAAGAAVKLDADENVTLGLTIGEGIETCIAGRLAGFRPVWALGSAGAIKEFPLLSGIEGLTILGEVDDGGKNYEATQACSARWIGAGRQVIGVVPVAGDDLNKVWNEV